LVILLLVPVGVGLGVWLRQPTAEVH
jgi:hypothetical protein